VANGRVPKQAEANLRQIVDGNTGRVTAEATRTVEHVGQLHSAKLIGKGRKPSHVETFDSHLRVHLAPFFKETPINRIEVADVEKLLTKLQRKRLAPKTIRNILGSLHSIFDTHSGKSWVAENPCRLVDKPESERSNPDVRFLTLDDSRPCFEQSPTTVRRAS
jgi:site-specific recombinase XerD